MVDYSFHQIIADASDEVIFKEIPQVVASGVRSLKVFLTYESSFIDDRHFLRVLAAARRNRMLVTVHCENYEAINWRTAALLAAGHVEPKYHAWSRPTMIEREATHRAIALAELVDTPIQVFHVSCPEVAEEIARAQARGLKVWAETCPQYFVLSAADMDRPGFEGAKFMCSPSPRDAAASAGLWDMVRRGTLDVVSSDHSGWGYNSPVGKRVHGTNAPFSDIRERAHRHQPVRAADIVEPGEAVRPVSPQGHHRARGGCRPRAVGPEQTGYDHERCAAARDRLHAL
jgi:dihydropyrimidinase